MVLTLRRVPDATKDAGHRWQPSKYNILYNIALFGGRAPNSILRPFSL